MERESFAAIGEEYIDKTQAFRLTDRPYFVDKMPGNWMNIPLIRAALPNAKIVNVQRRPMACGFSNFKQNYAIGIGFSYSQERSALSISIIGVPCATSTRSNRHVHRLINDGSSMIPR